MNYVKRSLAILTLFVLATGCTTVGPKPFIVTGESIVSTSKVFVATGEGYNLALDAKLIEVEDYRVWASFAKKFKIAFPLAAAGWESARLINDAAAEQNIAAAISILVKQLAEFGLVLYGLTNTTAPGGK